MLSSLELLSSDILHILGLKRQKYTLYSDDSCSVVFKKFVLCLYWRVNWSAIFTNTHRLRVFEIKGAGKCIQE
jgi:hypothetical protein